jgi:hypothetical protein
LNRAKKCLGGRQARRHRGKRCLRYVSIGSFVRNDAAGVNKFHFSGRLGRRKLSPGHYHLQAVPVFSGVTGTAAAASFRIIS